MGAPATAIRLIVLGTEAQANTLLREDRPDLVKDQILVLSQPGDEQRLRGVSFHACTAIRWLGDNRLERLYGIAKQCRTLPVVLAKRPPRPAGEDVE